MNRPIPVPTTLFQRLIVWTLEFPLLYKILIPNSLLIAAGAVLGVSVTRAVPGSADVKLVMALVALGVLVSVAMNFIIVKTAFRPFEALQRTVRMVRMGNRQARAPYELLGDRDIHALGSALNDLLDQLEQDARTMDEHRREVQILSGQIITSQEEDRRRIARELHDETNQLLSVLAINLELTKGMLGADQEAVCAQLEKCKDIARETYQGLRRLSFDLRPALLDDLGLEPAIVWFIRNRLDGSGITPQLETEGLPGRLPAPVETAAFRIVQEALTNVIRHAGCVPVTVKLVARDGILRVTIDDQGDGFNPYTAMERREDAVGGIGLIGMQERAAMLGGVLTIESSPGQGTHIRADIPLSLTVEREPHSDG